MLPPFLRRGLDFFKRRKNMAKQTFVCDANSVVKGVYEENGAVCFETGALYVRISYHGTYGWRLQTNQKDFDSFENTGASQALARYMGETVVDRASALAVKEEGNALRLDTEDGTYALLSLKDAFSLTFYSQGGKETLALRSLSFENDRVILRGALEDGEAVYGGGERFDTVNKRGTKVPLYICDGWNRSDTSYMAIPLFVSSRGSGFFVNRYEKMDVDFGAEVADEWAVSVVHDLMDLYVYANEDIRAPYLGYTQLSGHAYLPEEWAQGVIICRYAPDMRGFEDHPEFTTPLTYDDVIAAPVPRQAEPECKHLWIKRFSRATGELSYVKVGKYEDDDEYTYDASLVYFTRGGGKYYRVAYYLRDGSYYRSGSKGSPGGMGVKSLTEAFIKAGMKPSAMLMEALDWGNMSRDLDFCREREKEVKRCIEWLHEQGIKAMVYMGLGGGMSPCTKGFTEEYLVRANITLPDGTVEENTPHLLQTQGGENPDLGNSSRRGYIDITNPQALEWYFDVVWAQILGLGCDGVKIDFCEFVPDEDAYPDGTKVDYFWHDPSVFGTSDVHHGFPTYFISMFYRKVLEMKKERKLPNGFTVLSRGGGIGSQRNPYLWAGDQTRTFEKIEDQYLAVVNSGLSGVPFMSYDMAGYQYQEHEGYYNMGEEEGRLFSRAVECTAFTTMIQTHGDVRQAFEMAEDVKETYRRYTSLHDRLIPYIQKYSRVACETGVPAVRHLILRDHTDPNVYDLECEFTLGEGLLVAPIFADGVVERDVYLPRGKWIELLTGKEIEGGQTVRAAASVAQIPVYLDTECEDFEELKRIFECPEWQAIKNAK